MEYYLISFIISFIIFGLIQIYEYKKINEKDDNYEKYSLMNMNNALLILVLYIVITITCYYLNISNLKFFKKVVEVKKTSGGTTADTMDIEEFDPKILSKINDNFNVGFEPFDDTSSISSLSSSSVKNI
jgi:hypothetical protein